MENFSQHSQCQGWDLKPGTPEHEREAPNIRAATFDL